MISYRGYLYAANGGHNSMGHDGAIIRGNNPGIPAQCPLNTAGCTEWVDVSPCDSLHSGSSIEVTFDVSTVVEDGYDYIYVQDRHENNITGSPFTGNQLAGQTVTVPGTSLNLILTTDDTENDWGFKVTEILPSGFTGTSSDILPESAHNYNETTEYWSYSFIPDIPENKKWNNYGRRFSNELPGLNNIDPGDMAFSMFADFNGNLFLTRTACTIGENPVRQVSPHIIPGCNDGNDYNREAQLWKCIPETTGTIDACDSSDWFLIDGTGGVSDGITNFSKKTNKTMTMAVVSDNRLYVGFDNTEGIELWRTKEGVTNPVSEDDFEEVTLVFEGDKAVTHIYSAVAASLDGKEYLFISCGNGTDPVTILRIGK